MQTKSVVIRAQALDGAWEAVGSDRLRGVWPENDSYSADEWGPSKCSFDLRRDPGAVFPDLTAYTPLEVEIGGVLVWSGRIVETPIREGDRVYNVQGQGWQYHLDDDTYQRVYIANRLADFKDSRSIPTVTLNSYRAAGNVTNDKGLVLGWGQGENVQSGVRVGATFDMGAGNTCQLVVFELTWRNGHTADMTFVINGTVSSASPNAADSVANTTVTMNASTAETAQAIANNVFATPVRYVHVYLVNSGVDSAGIAGEVYARLRSFMCVAATSYVSANASVLTGDIVIKDALTRATVMLSADRSAIQTPTFALPSLALDGQKTPREVWQAVNAAQNWRSKIDVWRRPIFEPRPSAALIEIGAWPGATFDDASANSGDDIYNRVIVEGAGPDGEALGVERTQGQQTGVALDVIATPAPSNPSFATNTTSWTASAGTSITRDTTTFDTTPASGRWDRGVGVKVQEGDSLTGAFTGTFNAGTTYVLTLRIRLSTAPSTLKATFGAATDNTSLTQTVNVAGAWATWTLAWTPSQTTSSVTLVLTNGPRALGWWFVDSLVLAAAKPTLVDRRGFRRSHILPVKSTLTPELGQQIGDTWLGAHRTTPLKGTVEIVGDGGARQILTGASVPPEQLLLRTGDLIRLAHRTDPDYAAGQGRDGRIAEVTYVPATDTATVAIDNRRQNVEALLERLAIVDAGR